MVVDTSALVAVLRAEPDSERFVALLSEADDLVISTVTHVEASIVMTAKGGRDGVTDLDALLDAAAVRPVAVDHAQALGAREAFRRFGKGRAPAGLNFGDCFSYALAMATERPLLFEGGDFALTDVRSASA